jgi:hypothetical protein
MVLYQRTIGRRVRIDKDSIERLRVPIEPVEGFSSPYRHLGPMHRLEGEANVRRADIGDTHERAP